MTMTRPSHLVNRRTALRSVAAAALCATPLAQSQSSADGWRLLINEAFTADLSISMLAQRYKNWADYMAAAVRNKQVVIDPVISVRRFLEQARGDQKPLFVFGKSVNQLAKLVRDQGYQPVARRADPYKAAFITGANSTITSMGALAGRKILMPDEYAATTAVAKAELRSMNIGSFVSHTRFQESVAQQVAAGVAEAGVVNPTIARKWKEEGGRILGETQPVVNWSVLASPKAPPEMVARMTEALLAMNTQAAPILGEIGVKQWAKPDKAEYVALLEYTNE
ncbi:phosphate/phosphite/phosphonate ABC transporter substrate-binding protein [Ramlibacter tataouinensis]|nr:PhnD/SsuA/transferrin family substrate-binding protein [Ramlibacter tataouinensis]